MLEFFTSPHDLKGVLKKWFWSAKACFCDFLKIKMLLYPNNLIFEKNRTSKLVHSIGGFSTAPKGRGNRSWILYVHKLPRALARGFYLREGNKRG